MYMVGNGCLAAHPNSNCSWISGDAVFLARASGYSARDPDSLNDRDNWEFYCGEKDESAAPFPAASSLSSASGGRGAPSVECWTGDVRKAKPILEWEGRVGTVTATYHPVQSLADPPPPHTHTFTTCGREQVMRRYLFAITTPTVLPSTVGPYDTWVLEATSLTGPFKLVSYMPRFGQQACVLIPTPPLNKV